MKKLLSAAASLILIGALAGCSASGQGTSAASSTGADASTEALTASEETGSLSSETPEETAPVRIGSLKGPTSMGLVHLMNDDEKADNYSFTMAVAADELLASMVSEELDIALIPANVASVLYNKTEGQISVIDINTLGVLYLLSSDSSVESWSDLAGKTIYLTGKGTTPDYTLQYMLKEQAALNGFSPEEVSLEYKSEAAEVAAVLKEQPDAVGLLPQPFATVAMNQNEDLSVVFDMTEEWDSLQKGSSRLVTGVTVVRDEFLKEHPEAVETFLLDHRASAELAVSDPDTTASLVVKEGIIEKEPIAKQALPYCSIVYLDGKEMEEALSGYLNVLFEQDPKSVGGSLPDGDFYYIPQ